MEIEGKVKQTIRKFRLLSKKDKILVAASGGKDSTAVLYILKNLGYNADAITIDVNLGEYSGRNIGNVKKFCSENKIPLYIISIKEEFGCSHCYIRDALKPKGIKLNSCAVCGILRRYLLNKAARKLKANKIVTGHNMDDEAQSIVMNFFRNTLQWSARLGPKAGNAKDKRFIPRVKPLYFVPEREIEKYSRKMRFPVKYGRCPCASDVFRNFVRNLLNDYEKTNPKVKRNIVNYFMRILPELKKRYRTEGYTYCSRCGEPSKGKVCRTCQIVGEIKKV
jgi:uncharacterized protein (TIGR00269 family)